MVMPSPVIIYSAGQSTNDACSRLSNGIRTTAEFGIIRYVFWKKVIVLGRGFRQMLPVIMQGSRSLIAVSVQNHVSYGPRSKY
jgi:hypothetical protein